MKHKLFVVGLGPGDPSQLTFAARRALDGASCAVLAPRHTRLAPEGVPLIVLGDFQRTLEAVEKALETGDVAVGVSGDPGIFSLLGLLKKRFPLERIEVTPGISSLQSLCAAVGESWSDALILSGHGRPLSETRLLNSADTRRLTALFCGGGRDARWACSALCRAGLDVEVVVGERLSSSDQRVTRGTPAELANLDFNPLSLALIRNDSPWEPPAGRPRDADFERGKVPMTREEVRSVVLDRLELRRDSVLWDLGSGTGSVSTAAALCCPDGRVCAVERDAEAAELTRRNLKKFHCFGATVHEGGALSLLPSLPRPTRVFIGGSGGELEPILKSLPRLGEKIRVVTTAVTLDTLCKAAEILRGDGYESFDATQICISRSRALGPSLLMAAQNPVTVLTADTAAERSNADSSLK